MDLDCENFAGTIRPDDICLADEIQTENVLSGTIGVRTFLGKSYQYEVETSAGVLKVNMGTDHVYKEGEKIRLYLPKDKLILVPRIYTNKPRTTGEGYKGITSQPDPEKKPDFLAGLMAMRKMHIRASTTETTAAGSQAAGSEAAASAEETKAASGDAQKLVLSTYGLSEDISEEEVYTPFENEFNCEIVTETGGTNDRYTKLSADPNSTIDVIELSQAMTAKGTDEGLFDTIDLSKIPNAEKLIPAAKELAEAGQGVPYTINSIGIIYNPELTGFDITSFDDLWDERLAGKVSIPEITTTFGPAMVYVASDHAGVDVTTDNGEAAFKALADLKPNLVKTYTKSSDLINMFTSGEVAAAVVGDFGVPTIVAAHPTLVYVTPDGAYANFNTINVTKNCANKELAYEYINYRISEELQTKTGKALNEAPTNMDVTFTEEESKDMTYGDKAAKVKVVDYAFVNPILNNWIDQWNRTINN